MNEYIDRLNDRVHHLETLINEQNKLIYLYSKQMEYLKKDKDNLIAPIDAKCVCCTITASHIAKCGHYFCIVCMDRSHDADCIQCEKNKEILNID
jgi:hypothetical protein